MARYRVTVRNGPQVERSTHESLDEALAALESAAEAAAAGPGRRAVGLRQRRFEPVAQVAARVEVRGPSARGGVDVRGDGSVEAWTGGWTRRVVEREAGEDAYAALRRALGAGSASAGP